MVPIAQQTTFPQNHHYVPEVGWAGSAFTVLRAGLAITGPKHRIERAEFPGQDVLFCSSGRGSIFSEGKITPVGPGQLAWLANEVPHGHWPDEADPWTVFFVRIDGPNCPAVRRKIFRAGNSVLTVAKPLEIEAWFDSLFETLQARDDNVDLTLNRQVAQLIEILASPSRIRDDLRYPRRLRALIDRIRLEPEATWDANHLAAVTGLSPSQTRRLFQKHLQMSPRKWLTRERIMQAQRLLLESDATASTIAERCGFCDAYHFSREFKRSTGTSPGAWRKAEGR